MRYYSFEHGRYFNTIPSKPLTRKQNIIYKAIASCFMFAVIGAISFVTMPISGAIIMTAVATISISLI